MYHSARVPMEHLLALNARTCSIVFGLPFTLLSSSLPLLLPLARFYIELRYITRSNRKYVEIYVRNRFSVKRVLSWRKANERAFKVDVLTKTRVFAVCKEHGTERVAYIERIKVNETNFDKASDRFFQQFSYMTRKVHSYM